MFNRKKQRLIAVVICVVLVIAMVIPMFLTYLQ